MNKRHEQATQFLIEVGEVSPVEQAQRMKRFFATKPTCARHPDRRAKCVQVQSKNSRILALCKTCSDAFAEAEMDPFAAIRNDPGSLSRSLQQQMAFNEVNHAEKR